MVTEVSDEGKVYACSEKDGPGLEQLMDNIREEFTTSPPVIQLIERDCVL